jgi:hypothetical protein
VRPLIFIPLLRGFPHFSHFRATLQRIKAGLHQRDNGGYGASGQERLRDAFEEAELLDDLARILTYTDETLPIIEGYRGKLQLVLMRTFILDMEGRIEEFAKTYWKYVGHLPMRALCDELRSLLEEWSDVYG